MSHVEATLLDLDFEVESWAAAHRLMFGDKVERTPD